MRTSTKLIQAAHDFMRTRLPLGARRSATAEGALRDALEGNDGKMSSSSAMLQDEFNHSARSSTNQRVRRSARRPSRPSRARFKSRTSTGGECPEVDLVGRSRAESRMRPLDVVPSDVVFELAPERSSRQGHDRQKPRALVFQRADEPLNDGEAAVLADGAEALLDAVTTTPGPKRVRGELRSVVGHDVAGPATEGAAYASKPPRDIRRGRFLLEVRGPHRAAGEMIDDDRHPPAERPALRQHEWGPRVPESADRRYRAEVEVPDVVGMLGGHSPKDRGCRALRGRFGLRLQHPANGGRSKMESGAREHAGHATCPHPGAEHLESPNEIVDEVRKPVDGLPHLNQRIRPLVVESLVPRRDGQRRNEKPARGLRLRPASCRAQLEDREALTRRVVGPSLRGDTLHASVLDTQFFPQERDSPISLVEFGLEPNTHVEVVRGAGSRAGEGDARHRDRVDDGGADVSGPVLGQRNPLMFRSCGQESPHYTRPVRSLPIGVFRVY